MADKTKLEQEIEHHEDTAIARWTRIIIIILVLIICSLGVLSYNMTRDMSLKDQELMMMKEEYLKEKNELLTKIRRLEHRIPQAAPDSGASE